MSSMSDLSALYGVNSTGVTLKYGTTEDNTSLDWDDFLQLMVVTLQNQTIDDTADMSDMMNQMVQMSVVSAIDNISTLIEDTSTLTYAASLVGKEVTVGVWSGNTLNEIVGTVTGTGTYNGSQVIFLDNNEVAYNLSSIMAIGILPDEIVSVDDVDTKKAEEELLASLTGGVGNVGGDEDDEDEEEEEELTLTQELIAAEAEAEAETESAETYGIPSWLNVVSEDELAGEV